MQDVNRRSLMLGMGVAGLSLGALDLRAMAASPRRHGAVHAGLLEECIAKCTDCYQLCQDTLQHCLEQGGEHVQPSHIRLLLDCIAICKLSIDFMQNRSQFDKKVCTLCAEICQACADSCLSLSQSKDLMQDCAKTCRECAEVCLKMAAQ